MVKEDNDLNPTKMTKDEIDHRLRLTEVLLIIIGLVLTIDTSRLFSSSPPSSIIFVLPLSFVVAALVYYISISQEQFRSLFFERRNIFNQDKLSTNAPQIILVLTVAATFSASLSFDVGLISGVSDLAHFTIFLLYFALITIFTFFGLVSNKLTKLISDPIQLKLYNTLRKKPKVNNENFKPLKNYIEDIKTYIDFIREGNLPNINDLEDLLKRTVNWWTTNSLENNISQMVNRMELDTETNQHLTHLTQIISEEYPKFLKHYIDLYKKIRESELVKAAPKDKTIIYITGTFMVILGLEDKPELWPNYYETIKVDGNIKDLIKLGHEYKNSEIGKEFLSTKKNMLDVISDTTSNL